MTKDVDSSIFIKQSEIKKHEHKLKKEDLNKMIPESYLEEENIELKKTMTEWRWRIFEINGKTFTEISKLEPNKKRIYLNKYEKWVERENDDEFNAHIKKKYYYYTNL
ncbi:hypothetical protein Catovirus_1_894 [Catovirus CTV1]|uniref:Uncharacterized protein n=1 Tax=Catovirus CTV1 TaxID=1977631 RepID=A0A1V0SB01_9VIRU|nr:hypothetical protein Catovirus_1_894 [Catovirus CTV1]